jgi:DNA-directed RNA polymerase subunit M/transcription elongation factor TFIIS
MAEGSIVALIANRPSTRFWLNPILDSRMKDNTDRIYRLWCRHNGYTQADVASKVLGLHPTSLKSSTKKEIHIQSIINVLASKGVETDFFFKCKKCGYLNPNDRTEEEADAGPYLCEGCGEIVVHEF